MLRSVRIDPDVGFTKSLRGVFALFGWVNAIHSGGETLCQEGAAMPRFGMNCPDI